MHCISGSWEVKFNPEDREKTRFSTLDGHYHYFGQINAPMFSKTEEEHVQNLKLVCERLRSANLKLNPENCNLMLTTIKYLAHKISEDGIIRLDRDKTVAIKEYPVAKM
ncbi:hypothetical protein PR048_025579, partial [Dryococelus australis]